MSATTLRRASILGCVVLASACSESGNPESAAPLVRDSAGVRIVENTAARWNEDERWRLGPVPIAEIGVVEGEPHYMLSRVRGTKRLRDGSIVVLDGGSSELRFFDDSGEYLRSIGGSGDGPGEFRTPILSRSLWSDSLVVWQPMGDVTLISNQGDLGRTFSISRVEGGPQPLNFLYALENGDFVGGVTSVSEQAGVATEWGMISLVRIPRNGGSPTVLGETESIQCHPASVRGCNLGMAYGAIGGIVVQGNRIFTSRPDRNEIRILDADGHIISRVFGAAPVQSLTETMRNEFLDAVGASDPSRAADLRSQVQESFSKVVPAFLTFLVDSEGNIWTQEYLIEKSLLVVPAVFPPRVTPIRWTVFDPQGVQLGDVEVPPGLSITEVGENYVLGVFQDELGVEKVQMYSLAKP